MARPFHERTEGPFSGVYGRCFAGIASRELGRLDEAVSTFRSAHELAVTGMGRNSHATRLAEALLGELLVEMNQLDEAGRLLQDSRALGVEGGVADFSIATYVGSSRLLAQRGDSAAANDVLDEGEHAFKHLGFERLRAAVVGERVRHALLCGDLDAAQRWLMEAPIAADNEGAPSSSATSSRQAIEVHERVLDNQLPRSHWGGTLAALGEIELLGRATAAADALPLARGPENRPGALGMTFGTLKPRESNKEIARGLDIGVDTVKWYLKSIYGKLGVTSRAQAVLAARQDGALH